MDDADATEEKNRGVDDVSYWDNVSSRVLYSQSPSLIRSPLAPVLPVWSVSTFVPKHLNLKTPLGQLYQYSYLREFLGSLHSFRWSWFPSNRIIEMSAGIIVCCMPTAAAVFKRYKTPVMSRFSIHKHSRRISSREADQTPIYAGTAANHANIVSGGRKWPTIKNISSTQTMSPNKEDVIQLAPSDITVTMSVDMTRNEKT